MFTVPASMSCCVVVVSSTFTKNASLGALALERAGAELQHHERVMFRRRLAHSGKSLGSNTANWMPL